MKDGVNMNSEPFHPSFFVDSVQSARNGSSGRVNNNVYLDNPSSHLIYTISARCWIAEIGLQETNCAVAFDGREVFRLLIGTPSRRRYNLGASARQGDSCSRTNATVTACD